MKILIATEKPFAPTAIEGITRTIEAAGGEVLLLEKYTDKAALIAAVAKANGLIVRSNIVDAAVIEAAKELRIIVRAGAGYDNIDLEAATAHGVVVMNTPGQNANAVAELAIGMMLTMARNRYDGTTGTELKGKTLGVHAYGNVGRNVARIALGLGMDVYAYDPFLTPDRIKADGVKPVADEAILYATCQYVSLHIPATPQTAGSIDYALLRRMPKGATLVNTARKEVVNEEDLMKVMKERTDFRYIADVKPARADEFAAAFGPRVFFTPKKSGAQTVEANNNAGIAAAVQAVGFLRDGVDRFRLN